MDERPAVFVGKVRARFEAASIWRSISWLALGLAALGVAVLLAEMWTAVRPLWNDVHIPYAINFWSEPPLFVQIHRMANERPAYLPPFTADSWTYGPFYLSLLLAVDRIFEFQPSIVTLRLVSVWTGFLAVVPILLAVLGMRLRRDRSGPWASTVLAAALTAVLFAILDMRSYSFVALHPDALMFLFVSGAAALVVWFPLARNRGAVLGTLWLTCFAMALTNLNSAPLVAFFIGALVIEEFLDWRIAAVAVGSLGVALLAFFIAAPPALREWTFVIPAHLGYAKPSVVWLALWTEWTHNQPYQGCIVVAAIAALVLLALRGEHRQALAWTCLLFGTFAVAVQGLAREGGGPNELWFFYVLCLIPSGYAVDLLLGSRRPQAVVLVAARLVALAYIGLLATNVLVGTYRHPALPASGVAALTAADHRLRALCRRPGTIVATWFPDPYVDCPTAQLSMWDAIGTILIARSHGYRARIFLDDPITPGAFISYAPNPAPVRLRGHYIATRVPIWNGYTYDYSPQTLNVWTPAGKRRP